MSSRLRAIAQGTLKIVDEGGYEGPSGWADIADATTAAVGGTKLHLPGEALEVPDPLAPPRIEVTNESTLAAVARLGGDLACLVFASARNPGGGFRNGAQAQEESVARGSALYPCLLAAGEFYAYHRAHTDLTYSDRVIHSPAVPVFRDDRGKLRDAPQPVTFLTAAAPNLSAIRNGQPENAGKVPGILERRAARILQVAAAHGNRRLVLGAWGCGVFGNDPATVAAAFRKALQGNSFFDEVTFAVWDERNVRTFEEALLSRTEQPGR